MTWSTVISDEAGGTDAVEGSWTILESKYTLPGFSKYIQIRQVELVLSNQNISAEKIFRPLMDNLNRLM